MTQPATTVEQLIAAQQKEYSQFVAVQAITHDGALAYLPGHAVPASNVAAYGYEADGLVAKVGTKAAAAVSPTPDAPKGA
ncbi:MAG: hypothetical protein NVS3B26_16560 [Mycobacteriales bacterium]